MYPFTDVLKTTKKSAGKLSPNYIIVHHTAWWTYKSNIKYLSSWAAQASVHFVIWENEEACKIWEPTKDILWHSWTSQRWNLSWMNKYSLWIEVVWSWEYNIHQLLRLTDLVEYLMWVFNIPRENVLRHSDICQSWDFSKKKILWDWKRSSRKVDIWLAFFWWTTEHFVKWRSQLTPRKVSRYWNK